jgi:nucleoside-diphosphate-sugar epimerase
MNVLITGGAGFLGRATALRLKSEGCSVTAMGRRQSAGQELERHGIRYGGYGIIRYRVLNEESFAKAGSL